VQWWNSLFLTSGEKAFNLDGDDGDGSTGYGHQGTLTFDQRWDTKATWYHDADNVVDSNNATDADLQAAYTAQVEDANLLQISGSLWYDINDFDLLDDANTNFVLPSGAGVGSENDTLDNYVTGELPIAGLVRSQDPNFVITSTDTGDGTIQNIESLDPRARGDALDQVRTLQFQPDDGFCVRTDYRGAVGPKFDWLQGWTAMSAIENPDGEKILASPANTVGDAPTDVALQVTATASFSTEAGVTYQLIAIDENDNEQVVGTVVGNGETVSVADVVNTPVDSSKKYEVRAVK